MNSAEWHARIELRGRVAGAGFLIAPGTVLTCAHVVGDGEDLTVTFTERPGSAPVPARVVAHGGRTGAGTDLGDLAVLELGREMPIAPAALAPVDAAHGTAPRKLVVYGFPAGFDEGTLAEYRVTAAQLIKREWIQLEAWHPGGQPLAPGFSGAAVTLADTGEVVGMITAAAGTRDVRTGRMMPTQVMARYWPALDCLLRAVHSSGGAAATGVLIGSTVAELTAAQQAGVRFIGLARNTTAARQLDEAGCETTVTSLAPLLEAARSLQAR